MLTGARDEDSDTGHRFKSYGSADQSYYISGIVVSFLASLFGAIHCISWAFHFPSTGLQTLWRVCSLLITFSPLGPALTTVLTWYLGGEEGWWDLPKWLRTLLNGLDYFILAPLYIGARFILLGIAFRSLSTIPNTGHQTVAWTDFIPHI